MAALDSGDLIIGVNNLVTSQGSVMRIAQGGSLAWRYGLGARLPNVLDVSRHDRIIVWASSDLVIINPDGTLRLRALRPKRIGVEPRMDARRYRHLCDQ